MQKIMGVLQSRKFWASVIGLLVAVGVLDMTDTQQAELLAQLGVAITAIYTIATALEDGLSAGAWFPADEEPADDE